jgi:PAS domain S-box-containing protein
LLCDSSFVGTLGYSADEISPHKGSWDQLIHPEDAPRFAQALKAHVENLTPILELEQRVRAKSGSWRWVLTRGRIVERSDSGQPLRASGTNLDITAMKEAQKKIDALTHALIQAQERERERIALDLHDQVAQDLSAVRLALNSVSHDAGLPGPELGERVAEISERVREIARTVRDLSYELVPPGLEDLGLISTVQQYCREFSAKNGVDVELVSDGVEDLPLNFDTEINVFRVIQESLNNVAKHACAHNVTVRLSGSPSKIVLSIKDDGKGFDVTRESAAAITEKRMGLWCMEQRMALLGGTMSITSAAARGTEIVVEVPVGEVRNGRQEKGPGRR